ncbi:MAG: hypothetical protein HFG57_02185, partial [Lachnospiraceae bacterium]|nr:hypothetical protein [Lachnospiraceae bacterium]
MEGKKPAKNYFGREVIEGIRNKATRFLMVSLLSVSVLCVIVFIYLAVHMNYKSSETIGKIGKIYMSGMSEQVAMHFETAIELRLSQLNELVGNLQSGITDEEELRQRLAKEAQIRGFEYLAFYSGDGDFDMIYGEKIRLMDPPPFLHSLDQGEKKVAIGKDESDADIVLMGVPVDSRLPDGRECKALVAALPIHYIKETLFLNDSSSMEYYFIIRRDGSFILRRNDVEDESYFDRVLNRYGDVGGCRSCSWRSCNSAPPPSAPCSGASASSLQCLLGC